jgi:hypothetical protein
LPLASISAEKPPTGWRAPGWGSGSVFGSPAKGAGADASGASSARPSSVGSFTGAAVTVAAAIRATATATAAKVGRERRITMGTSSGLVDWTTNPTGATPPRCDRTVSRL